jgi:hypothetical protein
MKTIALVSALALAPLAAGCFPHRFQSTEVRVEGVLDLRPEVERAARAAPPQSVMRLASPPTHTLPLLREFRPVEPPWPAGATVCDIEYRTSEHIGLELALPPFIWLNGCFIEGKVIEQEARR